MFPIENIVETDVEERSDAEGTDFANGGRRVAEAKGEGEDSSERRLDDGRLGLNGSHGPKSSGGEERSYIAWIAFFPRSKLSKTLNE
jgi:hypothetical protein